MGGMDQAGREGDAGRGVELHPDAVLHVAFVEDGVEDHGRFKAFGFVDGHEADGVEVGSGVSKFS